MSVYEGTRLAVPVSAQDHVLGDPRAIATLVEYGDYECPACAVAYPIVQEIQQYYAGNLRFVFRNFPLSQAHPLAMSAAGIAEVFAARGRFWAMHDWLYENQQAWSSDGAAGLMKSLHELTIDEDTLEVALHAPQIDERIRCDLISGRRSSVDRTPSFFVNGSLYQGDVESLARAIHSVIAGYR